MKIERSTQGQIFDYSIITIIIGVIAFAVFGGYYGVQLMKANDQVADYHKSSGCVAEGITTDPLQSRCSWATYTVRAQERRKEFGKVTYHLSLTQQQGIVPDVAVPKTTFQQSPPGATLQVETWGDIPVEVLDDSGTYPTPTNPEVAIKVAQADFGLVTAILTCVIGAAVLVLIWSTKVLVATKPNLEQLDEPEVMPAAPTAAPYPVKEENLPWRAIDGDDDDPREDW